MEEATSNGATNGNGSQHKKLPSEYQQFIHLSRYARYREDLGRRETWYDTVNRYLDFFEGHVEENYPNGLQAYKKVRPELEFAITNLDVMPSMRCMMSAGKALERDHVAGFNCSFLAVDSPRAFDETMYILMCFHPDTEIITKNGNKQISEIKIGDQVYSYDEQNKKFVWESVINVIENPTKEKQKIELEFDNGSVLKCTADHKFLTHNRGWVEAQDLIEDDDIVDSKYLIYKITNKETKKSYIGYTSGKIDKRCYEHKASARSGSNTHFHKAIRKYDNETLNEAMLSSIWTTEIIDIAYTYEEALQKEMKAIRDHNTKIHGYNSTDGGEGSNGYRWTEEQRQNASLNAYERTDDHKNNQRKVLEQNFEKINLTRRTQKYRDENRVRNLGENNPHYGKTHTEQWKKEASERNRGTNNPFYRKKHTQESIDKMLETRRKNAERKQNENR